MRLRSFVLLAVLALLAACGGTTKVGSPELTGVGGGKQGRLGQFMNSPTASARPSTTASARPTGTGKPQSPDANETPSVKFKITANGYDPYYIRVFAGGLVLVTNKDSQARSVTADHGEFDSGSIPPGGSWTYRPRSAGKFNFHDGTRPYVVGVLEVLAA